MKFVSAGHCALRSSPNFDPGAIGVNNRSEASETLRIRNRVVEILRARGYSDIITDLDSESLAQYLNRIKPGNASVVCEFHFNAFNKQATGVEVLIEAEADRFDRMFAKELCDNTANILKLPNRGVKTESESRRGRLGLMREEGIIALVEVCFIDNPVDMRAFDQNFETLCISYAETLIKFDDLLK